MRYMDDARSKGIPQQPPPTIWNANTILKEPELPPQKPWTSKFGTLGEGNKKNQQGKPIHSRIPLAFPNCPNGSSVNEPYRSEPVTLKVPVINQNRFTSNNLINNPIDRNAENLNEDRAAVLIQRAFLRYKSKKNKCMTRESYKTQQASSQDRATPKSKESLRPEKYAIGPRPDRSYTIGHTLIVSSSGVLSSDRSLAYYVHLNCITGHTFNNRPGSLLVHPPRDVLIVYYKRENHTKIETKFTDNLILEQHGTWDNSLVLPDVKVPVFGTDYLKEGSLYFPERESVIVFGGIDPHSKYGDGRNTGRNIFRYNSEINQWDLVGELPQPRHHHSVVFLKGKVYLAGGTDPRDDEKGKTVVVGTVWSFDPVTRAWYKETEMLTPRKNFGLTVTNGKLLAIGGQDKDGRILSSVERYDPVTGVWEYIASLNTERTGAAAARFNDTVWVAGGMTSSRKTPLTPSVESYNAKYNVWTEQSPLRFPRCFGCLFPANDTLYFIGGAGRVSEKERTTSSCNAIDVWNQHEEEWKLHFAMSIPRHGHAVAYLGTQILIIGGVTTAYLRALTDVECFCCERKTWVRGLCGLPVPLSGHGAVTLPPASLM